MMLPGFKGERVNNFLSDDNIRRNVPVLYESCLGVINIIRQVRFQSISKRFRNKLINDIHKLIGLKS